VLRLLHAAGFSTQGNSRTVEGKRHPDRDAQVRYISGLARRYLVAGDPVISIDTKKKEKIGLYARDGAEWRPAGDPRRVRDHDFPDPGGGRAIPYGVYDIGDDSGFVSVGTDHDTAAFAVESVRRWWHAIGRDRYPRAARLLVTCDAGGSNGYRARAWKAELARLAAETGLEITVCHFPPGTSKWNKIEHRLFCHITRTWRGRPLTSYAVVVNTIAATTTATGLRVTAVLDPGRYPVGAQVTDAQIKDLEDWVITRHGFHGDWNYTLLAVPRPAPHPGPPPAPAPPPPRPAADPAVLDQPALTGLPPGAAAALAGALAEARLHAARGGRDRQRPPPPATTPGRRSPSPAISWPPSCTGDSPCPPARSPPCSAATAPPSATSCPAPAASWPPPPPSSRPGPSPWPPTRTCATTPQPPASPSPTRPARPQHATLATPGTPQTHLKKGRVLLGADGSPAGQAAITFAFEEAELRDVPLVTVCALTDTPGRLGGSRQVEEDFDQALVVAAKEHPEISVVRQVLPGTPRGPARRHGRRPAARGGGSRPRRLRRDEPRLYRRGRAALCARPGRGRPPVA
jgi:Rhodopirellula transposase DDE domain